MKTVEEFLKDNPKAYLADYKKYCDTYKADIAKAKADSKEMYDKWLDEQIGKYFLINFNNESYVLMKYNGNDNGRDKESKAISFYKTEGYKSTTSIKVEYRLFNSRWLDCLNPCCKEFYSSNGIWNPPSHPTIQTIEIPIETAEAIFAKYNEIVIPFINEVIG
jgi:hypothetical protein